MSHSDQIGFQVWRRCCGRCVVVLVVGVGGAGPDALSHERRGRDAPSRIGALGCLELVGLESSADHGLRERREITVDDAVVDTLRDHIAWTRRVHGAGLGLLFTSENDKMLRRSHFAARVLAPAVRRAGLPDGFTFHWLRHSHVSWLLAAGEPVTEVSARVGHKTPAITLARYSWAVPGNERSAANAMAAMSRGISRGIDPKLAEVVKLPSAL